MYKYKESFKYYIHWEVIYNNKIDNRKIEVVLETSIVKLSLI